jgi:hypothetical protein
VNIATIITAKRDYPLADALMAYVTVIEAAAARRDAIYALRRNTTPAEDEACSLAEVEIDEGRAAIRGALGLSPGDLTRLLEVAL